jgi:type II secretory pathway pseudopilin PulG
MGNPNPIRRVPKPSEEGYLLLAVMFIMALLVLSLAVAAPRIAKSIQRDREVETMRRGKQYVRAIRLYYRKFHAYPPNIDALVKTNDIRFLRKRYLDPMTGKDDWKPVLFGQNKTPTAMGFFGQPLATGGSIAGVGPTGGNGLNGANGAAPSGGLFNSSAGGSFGNSPGMGTGSSIFGSSNSTSANPTSGSTFNSSAAGSTDSSAGSSANGSSTASTSTGAGGTDGNGNPTSGGTNTGQGTGASTGFGGQTGQTFGGGGIIGFSPASTKQSILIYKKKDHYNEWEFTYDPIMEMMMAGAGGNTGTIGQPAGAAPGAVGIPGITTTGSDNTVPPPGSSAGPASLPTPPPGTPAPQQ